MLNLWSVPFSSFRALETMKFTPSLFVLRPRTTTFHVETFFGSSVLKAVAAIHTIPHTPAMTPTPLKAIPRLADQGQSRGPNTTVRRNVIRRGLGLVIFSSLSFSPSLPCPSPKVFGISLPIESFQVVSARGRVLVRSVVGYILRHILYDFNHKHKFFRVSLGVFPLQAVSRLLL